MSRLGESYWCASSIFLLFTKTEQIFNRSRGNLKERHQILHPPKIADATFKASLYYKSSFQPHNWDGRKELKGEIFSPGSEFTLLYTPALI